MEPKGLLAQVREYDRLWRELTALYAGWARAYGISYYALLILCAIWEHPEPCSQKFICDTWTIPKQTVNGILKEFTQQGLVTLTTLSTDRRSKGIALTDAGRAFAGEVIGNLERLEERVMARLGRQGRDAMLDGSRRYLQYFQEEMGETPT